MQRTRPEGVNLSQTMIVYTEARQSGRGFGETLLFCEGLMMTQHDNDDDDNDNDEA